MATYIKELHNKQTDDTIYPVTKASAVYFDDNTRTVEELGALLGNEESIIADMNDVSFFQDRYAGVGAVRFFPFIGTTLNKPANISGFGTCLVYYGGDINNFIQFIHSSTGIFFTRLYNGSWGAWKSVYPEGSGSTYQKKFYSYTYSITAGENKTITANDLGISTPSGYEPVALIHATAGGSDVVIRQVTATAAGTNGALFVKNTATSARQNISAQLTVLYMRT